MCKPFLCILGFHDWETIDIDIVIYGHKKRFCEEKICLRCSKYVDEIGEEYKKMNEYKIKQKQRTLKAKELLKKMKGDLNVNTGKEV